MSFSSWLIRFLGAALSEPGQSAKEAAFREAYGATIDPDEAEWRKLTGDERRDLAPMTQQRMQRIAHYLWESNLLANRLVELPVAFLLAEGVRLAVEDEENQRTLDRFWFDPINDMDTKLAKKARELALFGEQCYPAFVNELDGMVRIGYLDPALIETVVMDPDNPEQPIGIVTVKDRKGRARRYRVIINGDEDVFTARTRAIRETFADGEAFFFRVNDLSSGSRGRSDLLAQADWLDAYDQFLFGEAERYGFLRSFIWDVTLKNATPQEVEARAKKILTPKAGSVRVHNDAESWQEITPDLKATDTSEGARLLRNHVLGGATIPEHWFGGGGDVNRAVGAEMEAPTLKIYTMRQKTLKHMLQSIGRYVLLKHAEKEGLKVDWGEKAWQVRAIFPELSERDLSRQAAALAQIASAAAVAISQKLISRKLALSLIAVVAAKLGLEIDPEAELAAAEEEAAKNEEKDSFALSPGTEEDGGALREALELMRGLQQSSVRFLDAMEDLAQGSVQQLGAALTARILEAIAEHRREAAALAQTLERAG